MSPFAPQMTHSNRKHFQSSLTWPLDQAHPNQSHLPPKPENIRLCFTCFSGSISTFQPHKTFTFKKERGETERKATESNWLSPSYKLNNPNPRGADLAQKGFPTRGFGSSRDLGMPRGKMMGCGNSVRIIVPWLSPGCWDAATAPFPGATSSLQLQTAVITLAVGSVRGGLGLFSYRRCS